MKTLLYCTAFAVASAALASCQTRENVEPEGFGPVIARKYVVDPSIVTGSSELSSAQVDSFASAMSSIPMGLTDPVAIAIDFARSFLGSQNGALDFVVKNAYTTDSNGVTHVYLRQVFEGREILNADMNLNVWEGKVISVGDSFYSPKLSILKEKKRTSGANILSPVDAVKAAQAFFGIESFTNNLMSVEPLGENVFSSVSYSTDKFMVKGVDYVSQENVPCVLAYMQKEDETLELVWNVEMDLKNGDHWYNAQVAVEGGEMVSFVDWVSHAVAPEELETEKKKAKSANYRVFPQYVPSPIKGQRELVENPADSVASPNAWHTVGRKSFTNTQGNNVRAQLNPNGGGSWENNQRPDGGSALNFDFAAKFPEMSPNQMTGAAVTNLFYWNNMMHDIFHYYGFNEKSGNFQDENFGRGGLGNDGVIANAQDGSGYNNANFATPPDGSRPRMRMYVWTLNKPYRDGDFESPIIMHEYGHGISIRLTGGPANSNCLGYGEAGGMGEGWSDFFGLTLHMKESYNRGMTFLMGDYAYNGNTIRRYPYTTDMKVNPDTYNYITKAPYYGVHAKGEVWAMILLEAYWNFVDEYGYDSNWKTGKGGNNRILQNVVDGLKLQPCNPNFVSARNAILQADKVNFGGKGQCLLWKAFAKRGLGVKASAGGNEDFSVPRECSSLNQSSNNLFFF